MADLLDRVKALLPNKLSEARVDAPKEPAIPPVQANQSNTTIITAKEMDEHRDTSVRQALQRVTGVTVNEMVPGISSYVKLNGDDRVLILVDGQSLANAQGSGYGRGSVDLANLPGVGAIERIEVTKQRFRPLRQWGRGRCHQHRHQEGGPQGVDPRRLHRIVGHARLHIE